MNRKTFLISITLLLVSALASGCVAVVAAGAAAGAGTYVWANGKLGFEADYTVRQCHSATIAALNELQIDIKDDMLDNMIAKVKARTAVNEPVVVDIEPITPNKTRVEVRVGTWGNKTQSRIIMDAIQRHLF